MVQALADPFLLGETVYTKHLKHSQATEAFPNHCYGQLSCFIYLLFLFLRRSFSHCFGYSVWVSMCMPVCVCVAFFSATRVKKQVRSVSWRSMLRMEAWEKERHLILSETSLLAASFVACFVSLTFFFHFFSFSIFKVSFLFLLTKAWEKGNGLGEQQQQQQQQNTRPKRESLFLFAHTHTHTHKQTFTSRWTKNGESREIENNNEEKRNCYKNEKYCSNYNHSRMRTERERGRERERERESDANKSVQFKRIVLISSPKQSK